MTSSSISDSILDLQAKLRMISVEEAVTPELINEDDGEADRTQKEDGIQPTELKRPTSKTGFNHKDFRKPDYQRSDGSSHDESSDDWPQLRSSFMYETGRKGFLMDPKNIAYHESNYFAIMMTRGEEMNELNRKKDLLCLMLSYPMRNVERERHEGWIRDVLQFNRSVRDMILKENQIKMITSRVVDHEIIALMGHSMDDIEAYVPLEVIKEMISKKPVDLGRLSISERITDDLMLKQSEGNRKPIRRELRFAPPKIRHLVADFAINQILRDIENPEIKRVRIYGDRAKRVGSRLKKLPKIREMFDIVVQSHVSSYCTIAVVEERIAAAFQQQYSGDHSRLSRREVDKLLEGKNFLILLDGFGDGGINVSEVGTSWWNPKNIQKIVCTTHSKDDVGGLVRADLEINMEDHLLPWKLFCMNVGDGVVDSPHIGGLAVDVFERCGGDLLAIVLMGSALKEVNDVSLWERASRALAFRGHGVLFKSLAFICERLGSKRKDIVKHYALNMGNREMDRDDLIRRWIEDGLIGTPDEGQVTVEDLLKAFLLETSSKDGVSLQMREEIREELENLFRAERNLPVLNLAGNGLAAPPKDEEWEEAGAIHLMNNELSELPESPHCPQLRVLLLRDNPFLTCIPPLFFQHMTTSLRTLDLSHTRIRSLPESLFRLLQLREFFLRSCQLFMELPPEIGDLSNLEVLDLEGTELVSLPPEVETLSKLTCLKLSFYGEEEEEDEDERSNRRRTTTLIPENVIGKLHQLEELTIDVNPEHKRWNVIAREIIKEVCRLHRLRALKLCFPEFQLLGDFISSAVPFQLLSRFNFVVGGHLRRIISRLPPEPMLKFQQQNRCLKFVNGEDIDIPADMKEVLRRATAFFLDRHVTLTKFSDFGMENMMKLKVCVLAECKEIQTIVDGADIISEREYNFGYGDEEIPLGSLEYLSIHYMKNLKSIWKGPVQKRCLSSLKSLTLHTCPELTTIFTSDLLENVANLEEIVAENCPQVTSIVTHDLSSEEIQPSSVKHLPRLKKISLHYMQSLVAISSNGLCIAPEVEWIMSIYACPNLKTLSPMDVSSRNLKVIIGEVDWWNDLTPRVQPENPNFTFVPVKGATELMKKLAEIGGDQLQP